MHKATPHNDGYLYRDLFVYKDESATRCARWKSETVTSYGSYSRWRFMGRTLKDIKLRIDVWKLQEAEARQDSRFLI
jgi:hypothetical protein